MSAADVAAWRDPIPSVAELGAVHFVGIGGAGMSGIARILLARGVRVSGSDRRETATLRALAALGARVSVGHDAANLDSADTVVVSTAIRADNPELATARARSRNPRQDLDDLDAHRRRAGLRRGSVVRHRR
jgi:UDP-N-acetylmuramate--alanine ligase